MYQCLTRTGAFEIEITIENDPLFVHTHYGGPSMYDSVVCITFMQFIKLLLYRTRRSFPR